MKAFVFGGLLIVLWIILMTKTIFAAIASDGSVTLLYYSEMMKNSWQGQFNLDLFCLTIVCSVWMLHRDSSKIRGSIFALLNIYLGGVFTLAYLAIANFRSKGDASSILHH